MTTLSTVQDVVKRLRAEMPMKLSLIDPVSGQAFVIDRENLLALLVVDVRDVMSDAQTVAMLYAERLTQIRNKYDL